MKSEIPLISLCMIVGNEQNIIRRCLNSFKPYIDEICIVRAVGSLSPDSTKEIVQNEFNAIFDEYKNSQQNAHWPHVDDFASARNQSFSLATGKYVIWADADDVLRDGDGEKIRQLAESGGYDVYNFKYSVPNAKLEPMRERMFLNGEAEWHNAIHENCKPKKKDFSVCTREDIVFIHQPEQVYKPLSTERNKRILESKMSNYAFHAFYLHQENFLTRKIDDAKKWGNIALGCPDLGSVERYEVLLNLAQIEKSREYQVENCLKALALMPDRREAIAFLCMIMIDSGKYIAALSFGRMMMAIPKPPAHYWTHKAEWYGWKGYRLWSQCLRAIGKEESAIEQENLLFKQGGEKISLIHATRGRPQQCLDTAMAWLTLADNPAGVEHIFGIDEDDQATIKSAKLFRKVIVKSGGGCVAAWNEAANFSRGKLLIQLSDDWQPFLGWDTAILNKIGNLEEEKVLAISDGHRKDDLLCMAIMTRKRYEKQGFMFCPEYKSVYSDNEFSYRAYKDGVVIDGRDITIRHNNPFFNTGKLDSDKTYAESNSEDRYREGKEIFMKRNPGASV